MKFIGEALRAEKEGGDDPNEADSSSGDKHAGRRGRKAHFEFREVSACTIKGNEGVGARTDFVSRAFQIHAAAKQLHQRLGRLEISEREFPQTYG